MTNQERIQLLHPIIREQVSLLTNQANEQLKGRSQMRIVQGFRSFDEQQALYNQGRTTSGKIVTNAKPGQSFHNYGLAIDFALLIDNKTISWDMKADFDNDTVADWMEVVKVFTRGGFEWGGLWKFKDYPHFQLVKGYTWQQLLKKYNNKDFIPGTKYINL